MFSEKHTGGFPKPLGTFFKTTLMFFEKHYNAGKKNIVFHQKRT